MWSLDWINYFFVDPILIFIHVISDSTEPAVKEMGSICEENIFFKILSSLAWVESRSKQ